MTGRETRRPRRPRPRPRRPRRHQARAISQTALSGLGVDTAASDRVAPDREALPSDYSPLGSSPSFGAQAEGSDESGQNKTDELLIVGMEIAGAGSSLALIEKEGVQIDGDGAINPGATSVLHSLSAADNGWATPGAGRGDSDDTRQLRAVAAGDVDRDGFEEVVVVYVDTSSADRVLKPRIIEDLAVAVITGDFDGDGTAQIAVGRRFRRSRRAAIPAGGQRQLQLRRRPHQELRDQLPGPHDRHPRADQRKPRLRQPRRARPGRQRVPRPGERRAPGSLDLLRLRRWQHRLH